MATVAARYAMFPETPVTAPHMNPIGWNPLENIWSSHNRDTKRGRHTVPLQQDQHGNLLGLQTVHFREAFAHSDAIGKLPNEIGIAAAASPSISGTGDWMVAYLCAPTPLRSGLPRELPLVPGRGRPRQRGGSHRCGRGSGSRQPQGSEPGHDGATGMRGEKEGVVLPPTPTPSPTLVCSQRRRGFRL